MKKTSIIIATVLLASVLGQIHLHRNFPALPGAAEPQSFVDRIKSEIPQSKFAPVPPSPQIDSFRAEIEAIQKNYKESCGQLDRLEKKFETVDAELTELHDRIASGESSEIVLNKFNEKSTERIKLHLVIAFCQGDEMEKQTVSK